jgi:hypothetical protein
MSAEWVTVSAFDREIDASFARDRLEAAGIEAQLANQATVGLAWHMARAVGGVQLQVAAEDVERAEAVLAEDFDDPDEEDDPVVDVGPRAGEGSDEAEEAPPNERERLAERAFRTAVFAFLFWPIFIWAAILSLRVWTTPGPWRPHYRRRARWAAAFASVPWILVLLYLVASHQPPRKARDSAPVGGVPTGRYRV